MAINNSRDYLASLALEGAIVTDHLLFGRNREIPPGTYTPNFDTGEYDSVTFLGTARSDTLIGGGGEGWTFFLGSAGNDLIGVDYPPDTFSSGYADYSNARHGVHVDMSFRGSRTFTDESGDVRTVEVFGRARDGFGGIDSFMEARSPDFSGFSSVSGVFGTSHRDVMIGDGHEFYGAGGHDLLTGGRLYGGDGNDVLCGTESGDRLVGGEGNDRIFAGAENDRFVVGEAGNDIIYGGAGDDFIDGGVGADNLVSGAGNDIINPDVEFFQSDPNQPTDAARDVIRVTRADLGDFTDLVLSRSFEAGLDVIRFRDAVRSGSDYRIFHEGQTINPATGRPYLRDDLADVQNTVLQFDHNGDGFGDGAPDEADYFIAVIDVTLTEHDGFLLA